MIRSSAEKQAVRLYLLLLPALLLALLLCHLLALFLPPPWDALAILAANAALAAALPLAVRRHALDRLTALPHDVTLDGALLLDRGLAVHHVLCPLRASTQAKVSAGPSMLLLCNAAMLAMPRDAQSSEHRAILRFLKPMGISQRDVQEHYSQAHTAQALGLHWTVRHDGNDLRAYTGGPAQEILDACTRIWDGAERELTQHDRELLQAYFSTEEQQPLAFAMADMHFGKPGEAVFLGAFLLDLAMARQGVQDVAWLHRQGLEVTLTNLPKMTQARFSGLLGCPTQSMAEETLLITTDPALEKQPDTLVILPGATAVQALQQCHALRRRLSLHALAMPITLCALSLCCQAGGIPALYISLLHLLLCACAVLPMIRPVLPRLSPPAGEMAAHSAMMVFAAACFNLTNLFVLRMGYRLSGAALLFLLPVTGYLMAREIMDCEKGRLLPCLLALMSLLLLGFFACHGIQAQTLPMLYMLLSGLLCLLLCLGVRGLALKLWQLTRQKPQKSQE